MPHLGETSGSLRELQKTVAAGGGGGGGGVSDGDKGDITVAGGGTSWSIDAGAVSTSKLGGDITTAGKALLDDADAAAQRATLGLGTAATTAATDYAAAAHSHAYSSLSGLPTLGGASVLNVGTAAGTVAAGDHNHTGVYAAASHTHSGLAPAGGTTGQVLKKISATDFDYSWQADATGGGGGGSGVYGTATIDFGATPVNEASFTVTDAAVSATSYVLPFVMVDTTADNDTDAHMHAAASLKLTALPAAGSFTLYAYAQEGLCFGTFKVRYSVA